MSKGQTTKGTILSTAFEMATHLGLEGISIGTLASEIGMSKSGLFAHFGSKETLQCEVLQFAKEKYVEEVFTSVLKASRGVARIKEFARQSLSWDGHEMRGGCIFIAAAAEFDDKPGPVKEVLKQMQLEMLSALKRFANGAIGKNEFKKDTDIEQFAFDCYSLVLGFHHFFRLLDDKSAKQKLQTAIENLIDQYSVEK